MFLIVPVDGNAASGNGNAAARESCLRSDVPLGLQYCPSEVKCVENWIQL